MNKVQRVIPREEINIDYTGVLGSGVFGKVYMSRLTKTGETVAVKEVHCTKTSSNYIGSLTREMQLYTLVGDHPNVLKLIGVCLHLDSEILLVMEYCEHKSLDKFLRCHKHNFRHTPGTPDLNTSSEIGRKLQRLGYIQEGVELNSKLLIKIAIDISSGMEHLAKFRILHMDLASRNILINKDLTAKVGDLGLSTQLEEESTYYHKPPDKQPLPFLSIAPEVLTTFKFTPKSDIWGMGVLLWELFSLCDTPYKGLNRFCIKSKIENGYRLPKPEFCGDEMYEIMLKCWDKDPSLRPDFSHLRRLLMDPQMDQENKYKYWT